MGRSWSARQPISKFLEIGDWVDQTMTSMRGNISRPTAMLSPGRVPRPPPRTCRCLRATPPARPCQQSLQQVRSPKELRDQKAGEDTRHESSLLFQDGSRWPLLPTRPPRPTGSATMRPRHRSAVCGCACASGRRPRVVAAAAFAVIAGLAADPHVFGRTIPDASRNFVGITEQALGNTAHTLACGTGVFGP